MITFYRYNVAVMWSESLRPRS